MLSSDIDYIVSWAFILEILGNVFIEFENVTQTVLS